MPRRSVAKRRGGGPVLLANELRLASQPPLPITRRLATVALAKAGPTQQLRRLRRAAVPQDLHDHRQKRDGDDAERDEREVVPVSYTHLTLPTILRV